MSYFQKHLRHYEAQGRMSNNNGQTNALRNKKMNCQRVKTQYSGQPTKRNNKEDSSMVKYEYMPKRQPEQRRSVKAIPMRFATEGLGSQDNPDESIKVIFAEADNSMEEMMNSSLRQFDTLMSKRDRLSTENTELSEQNQQLKEAVVELMSILKNKLDKALRKQEGELKGVLADYLQLITKLLADKEELTGNLENIERELNESKSYVKSLQLKLEEYEVRQVESREQNNNLKSQLKKTRQHREEEQNQVIEQRITAQNNKIQTLYELLQHSQDQRKYLQQRLEVLQSDQKFKILEAEFEAKMMQKQKEFDEIIEQYEKVTNQTIQQKNAEIGRLKRGVESRIQHNDSSLI